MRITFLFLFLFLWGITGSQAQSVRPEQTTLRIMSYNIHNGVGMDGKRDYARIAKAILRLSPDVVALQELDSATVRSGGVDILRELAEQTLMHRVYAPAIDYQGGKYGIGLLAKEKPLKYKCVPLPGREEKRVLLVAEFEKYVFCATHFSLTEADQLASIPLILKEIEGTQKPVFLAGDLNAHPDSPVIKALREKFRVLTNVKTSTFPANEPKECIDYILGYAGNDPGFASLSNGVMNEPVASDHRPVFAELRLKTPEKDIFRTLPYLQNPVGNGITVSWLTYVPVYSWVEYGTDRENLKKAHTLVDGQVICNNFIHKIRLEGLEPGKTYYYRVCSKEILSYRAYSKVFGETAVSELKSFTMPNGGNNDFTAVIFNDIHKQHRTFDALYDQVKGEKYDFVFFNGDCIDDPNNEDEAVFSLSYFNSKVGADRVPVFYLRGNHEIRNAYSIGLRGLFDYVGDKTYGAFSWGDTRFVMLDCGEDKPDSTWVYYGLNDFTQLRNDQVGFLKEELASKAFKKADKRVLIHHIPIYGSASKRYNPCRELWGKLLDKAPFNVAINAHTHRYAFHEAGEDGQGYPVVVGGGYSMKGATVMVLTKKGKELRLKVLAPDGEVLKDVVL